MRSHDVRPTVLTFERQGLRSEDESSRLKEMRLIFDDSTFARQMALNTSMDSSSVGLPAWERCQSLSG